MTDETAEARRARGLAMFEEVYGNLVPAPPPGASDAFDLLVIDQQFAEMWTRDALPVPSRRLLTMGVLAARGGMDTLEMQFRRALQIGELDVEQVREAAIHLISYAGTTEAGGILGASEKAIATHLAEDGA